jgi:hypothetical protein
VRQWMVESMMLSLYWMGMDQPAKGTILPTRGADQGARSAGGGTPWAQHRGPARPLTAVLDVEVE